MNDIIWIVVSLLFLVICSFGLGYIIGVVKTREETEKEIFCMLHEYMKKEKQEDDDMDVFYDVHETEENLNNLNK